MTDGAQQRALVLRAQSGDRESFDALLREIGPALLRYVARLTDDPTLAEDVVQEALIAIVRKIAWLSDPALFRPWAYRIASREAFRQLRRRGVHDPLPEVAYEAEPADVWQRERLEKALTALSPASRAVITLHYLEEMTISEVAAVLEISAGTARSRLAYGLTQLRKEKGL